MICHSYLSDVNSYVNLCGLEENLDCDAVMVGLINLFAGTVGLLVKIFDMLKFLICLKVPIMRFVLCLVFHLPLATPPQNLPI